MSDAVKTFLESHPASTIEEICTATTLPSWTVNDELCSLPVTFEKVRGPRGKRITRYTLRRPASE